MCHDGVWILPSNGLLVSGAGDGVRCVEPHVAQPVELRPVAMDQSRVQGEAGPQWDLERGGVCCGDSSQ